VRVERVERALVVTIDRPQRRNAVDARTAGLLVDAFVAFDEDDTLDVAVLTGSGGTFCAGADLQALVGGELRDVTPDGPGPMGPTRLRLTKPVVAAVEGHAVAGGLELALWCDLRVVASDAVLGVFCRRVGVPLIDLGTVRLPRLVGHGRAMDLILTGRAIGAAEAERIGLVSRVVEPGEALPAALRLARELSSLPQTTMRHDRLSAIEQWDLRGDDAARNEVRHGLVTLAGPDPFGPAAGFLASRRDRAQP
jgi:enoyl-CoA hydratase